MEEQSTEQLLEGLEVDRSNLYREETLTDLKVATLKQLIPVNTDGSRDLGRQVVYLGQTQLMSQMGPLPVQCRIEADSLEDAMDKFPAAVAEAVDAMVEEAREMRRNEMNRIVAPSAEDASRILK